MNTIIHTHKVLIVEDDESIRELVSACLDMAGITTIEADNGSLEIDIISRFPKPQEELCAILLDMMLPTVNGLGVLAYLKGRGNSIPVIAMSADRNLLAEAIKSDAHAAIAKPFDVHELLSIVTNQCQCK